jgi:hypothetical protein
MTRLLSIALAILIGTALSAKPQDCCDPAVAGQCHHSKTSEKDAPCGPTLSSCPDVECLTEHGGVVSLPANSNRTTLDPTPLAQPFARSRRQTSSQDVCVWHGPPDRAVFGQLYLRNHVLVI